MIVGITTILTTASTSVIVSKYYKSLENSICAKIEKIHERINKISVRLGIVEFTSSSKCAIP